MNIHEMRGLKPSSQKLPQFNKKNYVTREENTDIFFKSNSLQKKKGKI